LAVWRSIRENAKTTQRQSRLLRFQEAKREINLTRTKEAASNGMVVESEKTPEEHKT
jgi:hypothetical protein